MGPKNDKIRKFFGKNGRYRSIIGHDPFRSGRGRIQAGKTDRGRARGKPSRTENGHPWPKLWPNFAQIFGHHPGDPGHSAICMFSHRQPSHHQERGCRNALLWVSMKCSCESNFLARLYMAIYGHTFMKMNHSMKFRRNHHSLHNQRQVQKVFNTWQTHSVFRAVGVTRMMAKNLAKNWT